MAEDRTVPGKRRPTDDDLPDLMLAIAEGKSLRAACFEYGLDPPSTHTWLDQDEGRRQQYARARECRAEVHAENGLAIGYAAATGQKVEINGRESTIDAAGARTALDAIKWATARMAPKSAPVQRHAHTFEHLTEDEIDGEIAALAAVSDDEAADEG